MHRLVTEEEAANLIAEHRRKHALHDGCDDSRGRWSVFVGCVACRLADTLAVDNEAYRAARDEIKRATRSVKV